KILELECPEECITDFRRWICRKCGEYVKIKLNSDGWQVLFCPCGSKRYKDKLLTCYHPSHQSQEPSRIQEISHPPVPSANETQTPTVKSDNLLSSILQQLQKIEIRDGEATDPKIFTTIISIQSN